MNHLKILWNKEEIFNQSLRQRNNEFKRETRSQIEEHVLKNQIKETSKYYINLFYLFIIHSWINLINFTNRCLYETSRRRKA